MKQIAIYTIGCILVLGSCGPTVLKTINKNYPMLNYKDEVILLGLEDTIPNQSEELGEIKIGDSGFTTKCSWEQVIELAKFEARKVGGNAIKITDHISPNMFSSCHRIRVKILKIDHLDNEAIDNTLVHENYAVLNIYRYSGIGPVISYNLYLGDSLICRVSNKSKNVIKIKKEGFNTLWARTETLTELPINIKYGNEYYIRCSITMGAIVGRPRLELIDKRTGKSEFQSFKLKRERGHKEIDSDIENDYNDDVYYKKTKSNGKDH